MLPVTAVILHDSTKRPHYCGNYNGYRKNTAVTITVSLSSWLVWFLCHTLCVVLFVLICFGLHSYTLCGCLLYCYNMVRWAWQDWELSGWLMALCQCFHAVGYIVRSATCRTLLNWLLQGDDLFETVSGRQSTLSSVGGRDPLQDELRYMRAGDESFGGTLTPTTTGTLQDEYKYLMDDSDLRHRSHTPSLYSSVHPKLFCAQICVLVQDLYVWSVELHSFLWHWVTFKDIWAISNLSEYFNLQHIAHILVTICRVNQSIVLNQIRDIELCSVSGGNISTVSLRS